MWNSIQDDWSGWIDFSSKVGEKVQTVGDDLTVTNIKRIKRAADEGACNALLLKVLLCSAVLFPVLFPVLCCAFLVVFPVLFLCKQRAYLRRRNQPCRTLLSLRQIRLCDFISFAVYFTARGNRVGGW